MKLYKNILIPSLIAMLILVSADTICAQGKVSADAGADFVSRYVWRGMDIGATPSIQPWAALGVSGFELGFWGAYALSNNTSGNDESDIWLSYTYSAPSGYSITAIATDFYYPNGGAEFFNFNNHDATAIVQDTLGEDVVVSDAGAHLIELGLTIAGPESMPFSISGYMNIHNDAGNNTYFQADYSTTFGETGMSFFLGATGGSEDNPGYYGADGFALINVGFTASKEIKITDDYALPIFVTYAVNPEQEATNVVFGLSF